MTDPDLQTLWQSQQSEEPPMKPDEIRAKARKFQDRIRVRNGIEYAASAVVVPAFAWMAWRSESPLITIGAIAVVIGTFVMVWQMHVRGGARRPPEAADALLDFQRAELARQRDALASVPLWYLGPFVPGLSLILLGQWRHAAAEGAEGQAAISIGIVVAVFAGAWLANHIGARRLQKQIDQLDALRRA